MRKLVDVSMALDQTVPVSPNEVDVHRHYAQGGVRGNLPVRRRGTSTRKK